MKNYLLASDDCFILPKYAANASVLALLQYDRYTLIRYKSDCFINVLTPIIEPFHFENGEALRFLDSLTFHLSDCFVTSLQHQRELV